MDDLGKIGLKMAFQKTLLLLGWSHVPDSETPSPLPQNPQNPQIKPPQQNFSTILV